MKVLLFLLAAVIVVSHAASDDDLVLKEWRTFKMKYKKHYNNKAEQDSRMEIFVKNKQMIAEHNAKYEKGLVSYKLELNEYGDMPHREFVSTLNGFRKSHESLTLKSANETVGAYNVSPSKVRIPKYVDWTKQGAVTPVQNQGQCGSCWAFSATGAVAGQHFRKTGVLVSLSVQNLVDCSGKYDNKGCGGGWMNAAFQYIKDNKGIGTEKSYPYEAKDGVCRFRPEFIGATISGFQSIPEGDDAKLKLALATIGPISVALDSSRPSFQFYSKGVYFEPNCSSSQLNHALLAVGYGTTEDGQDYWLIKNSWGDTWGEKGYFKMARNVSNHCGISAFASYPLV